MACTDIKQNHNNVRKGEGSLSVIPSLILILRDYPDMEKYVEDLRVKYRVPGSDHKEKEGKRTRGHFQPPTSVNKRGMRAPGRQYLSTSTLESNKLRFNLRFITFS